MDSRKAKRSRSTTAADDAFWDCPLCTYRNKNESFRCEMCNMRKGTSTRKPRITQVTQQLAKIENQIEQERKKEKRKEIMMRSRINRKHSKHFKFENAQTISITVNDVTVFITDVELNSHENEDESSKSLSTKSSRSKLELDSKDSADNTASSDNDSFKNETDPSNNE